MKALHNHRRAGVSLIEVVAVLAILLILGAMLIPTFRNTERDTKVKAGTDIIRTKIAEGRGAAIEDARAYRLSISPDQLTVRVEPDDLAGVEIPPADDDDPPFNAEEVMPKEVTVVAIHPDGSAPVLDSRGWTRVVTFLPDGTCREDSAVLEVRQVGIYTQQVIIRGLTGGVSVAKGPVAKRDQ